MNKLILIHPKTRSKFIGYGDSQAMGIYPLSLAYVAALTPADWTIKIIDEYTGPLDLDEPCDLVGITAYTSNATRAYELAAHYKSRGTPVVLGGLHASLVPDEAAEYVTSVVTGEAESVWPELIEDFLANRLRKIYRGEPFPLDKLPHPRRDLLSDNYFMDAIQTTRGCPFNCSYCCIANIYGKTYRSRPVDDVLDELASLEKKLVYFIDDNFFGGGQKGIDRALAICKGMLKRKIKKYWATQASLNIAEYPEALKYAYKSGCRGIFVGVESISDEALEGYNKKINSAVHMEGMMKAIKTIQKHGICVTGSFIFGEDHEDITTFDRTLRFMRESKLDVVQIGFLTPYPGTKIYADLKAAGRMVYNNYPDDWDCYDTDHITYKTGRLKPIDIIRGFDYIARHRFTRAEALRQAIRTFINTRSVVATMLSYTLNRDSCDFFDFDRLYKTGKQVKGQS